MLSNKASRIFLPVALTMALVISMALVLSGFLYRTAQQEWQGAARTQINNISRIFAYWIDLELHTINGVAASFYTFPEVEQEELQALTLYHRMFSQSNKILSVGTIDENAEGDLEVLYVSQDSPWVYKGMKLSEHPAALSAVDNLLIETDQLLVGPVVADERGNAVSYVASLAPSDNLGGLLLMVLPLSDMLNGLKRLYFLDGMALELSSATEIDESESIVINRQPSGNVAYEYQQRIFHSDVDWILDWKIYDNYRGGINTSAANITLYLGVLLALLFGIIVYVLRTQATKIKETVERQTKELHEKNDSLVKAQQELVQSEKMASLGNLVAGVAHELNTPLGVSYTGITLLLQNFNELEQKFLANKLSKSSFEALLKAIKESAGLVEGNISRSVDLISNFKMVAVDQSSDRRREFLLTQSVNEIITTLNHKLKQKNISVEIDIEPSLTLDSYPGSMIQVLSNLILNSIIHGYESLPSGVITISAVKRGKKVVLTYQDDGKGIPKDKLDKVFNPFYTTKLGQGGSGLGLNIVYNLVHKGLGGKILLDSDIGQGVTFTITLPLVAPQQEVEDEPETLEATNAQSAQADKISSDSNTAQIKE